jgi:hypothetical protein
VLALGAGEVLVGEAAASFWTAPVGLVLLPRVDAEDLETEEVLDGTCDPDDVDDEEPEVEVLGIKTGDEDEDADESKVEGVGEFATIPKSAVFVREEVVFGFFGPPENMG